MNGATYRVDTTPVRRLHAEVVGLLKSRSAGWVGDFLREATGKESFTYTERMISKDEERDVVYSLGWKFSTSRQWRELWEYYRRMK